MRKWCVGLAVLLSTVAVGACQPDIFGPTEAPDVYSGRWRGDIGDYSVVVPLRAERGFGFALSGEATYTHRTSGETKSLRVSGHGSTSSVLLNFLHMEPSINEFLGQFSGTMIDGRTMTGSFRGPRASGRSYDGVLGVEQTDVRFGKE